MTWIYISPLMWDVNMYHKRDLLIYPQLRRNRMNIRDMTGKSLRLRTESLTCGQTSYSLAPSSTLMEHLEGGGHKADGLIFTGCGTDEHVPAFRQTSTWSSPV